MMSDQPDEAMILILAAVRCSSWKPWILVRMFSDPDNLPPPQQHITTHGCSIGCESGAFIGQADT